MTGPEFPGESVPAEPEILKALKRQSAGLLPFHMPGHKGNTRLAPYLKALGAGLDLTETEGLDCLNAPQGLLKDSMELAARLFHAERSFYLVNGSTAGILAGIRALTRPGDRVLVARHCHISVFHALSLMALRPVFLWPPLLPGTGTPGSLSPETVREALRANPDARLLVLVSPTYEGVLSDLEEICSLAREAGVPVLADEAHGAHLDLSPHFTGGAVRAGAEICVQSLHKTLPSPTQTAILHARGEALAERVAQELRVFQTSSPSWLLLASLDGCVRLLLERGEEIFRRWARALDAFDRKAAGLRFLKVAGHPAHERDEPHVFARDPGKLLISCAAADISGQELARRLRRDHRLECEMAGPSWVLAMTGPGDSEEGLLRLAEALLAEDRGLGPGTPAEAAPLPRAETVLAPFDAQGRPWCSVPAAEAVGRVCAEFVTPCPPGIPLLVPGERVTREAAERLLKPDGSPMRSRSGGGAGRIAVLL